MLPSRRSFLTALLASPLLAHFKIDNILETPLTLLDFRKRCAKAGRAEVFIVPKAMFDELFKLIHKQGEFWGFVEWANRGFDHLCFEGHPVIWYWENERDEMCQMIAEYGVKRIGDLT